MTAALSGWALLGAGAVVWLLLALAFTGAMWVATRKPYPQPPRRLESVR